MILSLTCRDDFIYSDFSSKSNFKLAVYEFLGRKQTKYEKD